MGSEGGSQPRWDAVLGAMAETNGDVEAPPPGQGEGKLWKLDQRLDQPLGADADRVRSMNGQQALPLSIILRLAYQSLGVVYGDLGTSPLYVFSSTFPRGTTDSKDIIGALSLIIYTITLIPLIKYIFIVLRANDNGEGGTFALYSLLCRYCNIRSLPNRHHTDEDLTTYIVNRRNHKSFLQRNLESSNFLQKLLLVVVLFGTCMMIGDGILTPAISVLSAVKGIKAASPNMGTNVVTIISLVILVGLFSVQRFGTARVAFLFAPIYLLWFVVIAILGIYNIIKWDTSVFQAFSPLHIIYFFRRNKRSGWEHLGGIVLCITGTEALFADLGHFTYRSIQIAFSSLVYPCLLLAYLGQAAYLSKNLTNVDNPFYSSLPSKIYWPMLVLATISAVIASQAIITATFSIVKQSVALGCFPRVKIVHTSHQFQGQVYIPEINWILMVLCLVITAGLRDTNQIGNAYGIAVVFVLLVTTWLTTLVMIMVWHKNVLWALLFLTIFASVESVFISSVLFKVVQGGWVPLVIAASLGSIMFIWHYGTLKRYQYEIQNKVSVGWLLGLGPSLGLVRVPGMGLVYTELAHGVPPIFSHFITNLPAIHSTVVFVCIKYLPVSTVPLDERFLIGRIGGKSYSMYRCAARYGYKDLHKKDDKFERSLIESLTAFIQYEAIQGASTRDSMAGSQTPDQHSVASTLRSDTGTLSPVQRTLRSRGGAALDLSSAEGSSIQLTLSGNHPQEISSVQSESALVPRIPSNTSDTQNELEFLRACKDAGVVYLLGSTILKARKEANIFKKFAINYAYSLLRRSCRESRVVLNIPHECLLQVGMVYYV